MKLFLKTVGVILLTVAALKGIQMLVDKLYRVYGQKYVVTEISED